MTYPELSYYTEIYSWQSSQNSVQGEVLIAGNDKHRDDGKHASASTCGAQ